MLQRSRGRFSRLARDALGSDEWKKKWTDIDSIGRKIDAGLGSLVSTKVMEVSKDMDTIKDMQKAMLECLEVSDDDVSPPFPSGLPIDATTPIH